MYDFYNKFAKVKVPGVCLCCVDTDSFIYVIPISHEDLRSVLKENEDLFDFSEYPQDDPLYSSKNKKVRIFGFICFQILF